MRRPLLFQRVRLVGWRARHSFSDGLQLTLDQPNILVLAKHRIAQFEDGAFKIRHLRLQPFQRVIGRGQCLTP